MGWRFQNSAQIRCGCGVLCAAPAQASCEGLFGLGAPTDSSAVALLVSGAASGEFGPTAMCVTSSSTGLLSGAASGGSAAPPRPVTHPSEPAARPRGADGGGALGGSARSGIARRRVTGAAGWARASLSCGLRRWCPGQRQSLVAGPCQ